MEHRHITSTHWTLDAIDSALERGDLPDWRELFAAAKADKNIAVNIIQITEKRHHDGASFLARQLAILLWPELAGK
jgi:hypothetical protein